jgi:hypothetical protein
MRVYLFRCTVCDDELDLLAIESKGGAYFDEQFSYFFLLIVLSD